MCRIYSVVLTLFLLTLWGSPNVSANALRSAIYDGQIAKWNAVYNPSIPWVWAKAQLVAESRLDTNATSPVAMGLGQFMPDTWTQVSKELGFPVGVKAMPQAITFKLTLII